MADKRSRLIWAGVMYLIAGLLFSLTIVQLVTGKYVLAAFNAFVVFSLVDSGTSIADRSPKWIHFFRKYNLLNRIFPKRECWCVGCVGIRRQEFFQAHIDTWQGYLQQNDEIYAEICELLEQITDPVYTPRLEGMLQSTERLREEAVQQIKDLRKERDARN